MTGGGTGPVTTVVGTKGPVVWAERGWLTETVEKPNLSSTGGAAPGTVTLSNAVLPDPLAEVVNLTKTVDSWAAEGWVPALPSTGASAGTPGVFTPTGSEPPASLPATAGLTASPTTAWTQGQYVVLGDGSNTYWNGTNWASGKTPPPPPPPTTGATAGTPGSLTPSPSTPPTGLSAMSSVTANPTTPWTQGQYVVLGDSSQAYWSGTSWQAGAAPAPPPAATGADAGIPGSFTPSGSSAYDLAAMATVTANPTTAWTSGQYVVLGDTTRAYWDGTAWVTGTPP
jgi:hypothetical protein